MISTIKNQTSRLINWKNNNPKKAMPILGVVALVTLFLFSVLIALLIQKGSSTNTYRSSVAPQQQVLEVSISKDGFTPGTVEVKKGAKIRWINNDQTTHQLQANPHPTGESLPGLRSEILNNEQIYEYTADTTGAFGYHDQLNPTINGTIEVKD